MEEVRAKLDIINARVSGYADLQRICIDSQGKIARICPMGTSFKRVLPLDFPEMDVAEDWISLGGIDLQINGALGLAFTDIKSHHTEIIHKICQFLWDAGVDGFLPTLVTTSVENIKRSLTVIADFVDTQKSHTQPTAQILGVHLEGPFLNPQKRGAHPAEYLLPLTLDNIKQVLGDRPEVVRIITLAPELDPLEQAIPYLKQLGITVSLGHSLATAAQAERAFALGATMVTHAFNAMPPLHHREPGLLGAALTHPGVKSGLIADGQHICKTMLQLLLRASNNEQRLFLVSDALAPLGLPDGTYPWDNRQIIVAEGTARLPDNTLSGTTLPLLAGVQNLVKWGICEVENAIALATVSPRQAIDLPNIENAPATHLIRWQLNQPYTQLTWQRLKTSL
ncbi:N-acetylglucosamine-6-phosphate deacetylase [Aliterella atlantica]|uniref:N-acetylglucosamine-6-phosphate deacetylase n=1 Tax=Aliterella atlantica CENA595 TaxID=1618023 RepID=A0A0D8ZU76_9CYAN|nr:N-acetylglucosamine-6-phosphate deacetylase [Aliterella atlantica]KJH72318.1 N-acetylglucosamine-6-phosphate deacetylase [Aliterella atlantica CENA595]